MTPRDPSHLPRPSGSRRRRRGQSLVEFALVLPIFVSLLMGMIEFAFVFNATLSVNYAARDAALAGAEAGNAIGADCVIVDAVEHAVGSPTTDDRITMIEISKANPNGGMIGSATVYTRTTDPTDMQCTGVAGIPNMPYDRTANGYAEIDRCNILGGCPTGSATVDNISVRITYHHAWVTPLPNFIGGGPGGLTFSRDSIMRMEPIL